MNLLQVFIRDYAQIVALVLLVVFSARMLGYLNILPDLSAMEMAFLGALTALIYDAVRLFIRRFL
jgi:hypothetical protein